MKLSKLYMTSIICALLLPQLSYAQGHGIYGKIGVVGTGLGYSYGLSQNFSVRTDFTTVGTFSYDDKDEEFDFKAKFKANQLGFYGDWFPFDRSSFRLSGGLHVRKIQLDIQGTPNQAGNITINDTTVNFGPGDFVGAEIKFPTVAPYFGIGFGHNNEKTTGFGFVFDLGVSVGKPKTTMNVNDGLKNKLDIAAKANGTTGDAEIEKQRKELADTADTLRLFPHLYFGLSYRF